MTDASGATGSQGGQGSGDAATGTGAATGAAEGAAAEGQQQGSEQERTDGQQQEQQHRTDTTGWPAEAREAFERQQRDILALRRERGDERINAKNQAAQEGARKALAEAAKLAGLEIPGLTDTDKGEADPKALAHTITTVSSERDDARKAEATVRAAWAAGVDPTKVDYLMFQLGRDAGYKALALDSSDFSDKLGASITALVAKDATLKLTGSAVASGVETLGGSNGSDKVTPEAFQSMSIADRQALYFRDKPLYDQLVAAQK